MPNHYETVIIFSPLLAEEDVKREIAKYTKMVSDAGATIVEERTWGLRQLAYPTQGKSNGIYYIVEFQGEPTQVSKLEIEFKRDDWLGAAAVFLLVFVSTILSLHFSMAAFRSWSSTGFNK